MWFSTPLGASVWGSLTFAGVIENVKCAGTEQSLHQCNMSKDHTGVCPFDEHGVNAIAGVICYDKPITEVDTDLKVRLTRNGQAVSDAWGMVEIQRHGLWGQVCMDKLQDEEATVVCRMLGYHGGRGFGHTFGTQLTTPGPIWLTNVTCVGNETSLEQCNVSRWGMPQPSCSRNPSVICYREELAVSLSGLQTDNKPHGTVSITYDGIEGTMCAGNGWNDHAARITCQTLGYKDGKVLKEDVAQESSAVFLYGVYCRHAPKLKFESVNDVPHMGRLVLTVDGEEGRVCADGWNDRAAFVACTQMGYRDGIAMRFPKTSRPVFLSDVICYKNEENLLECESPGWGRFNDSACNGVDGADAGVMCFRDGWQWNISNKYHGLVRVSRFGMEGVICEEGWTDTEASALCRYRGYKGGKALGTPGTNIQHELVWMTNVTCPASAKDITGCTYNAYDAVAICRTLGFVDGVAYTHSHYGSGAGPVYLTNMRCRGDDTSLLKCPNAGWGDYTQECSNHTNDASVYCYAHMRLQPNESYGAVELWMGSHYAQICDDGGFDDTAAGVVCRELGYRAGKYLCCSHFNNHDHISIHVGQVACTGAEEKFENCKMHRSSTCDLGKYVSVACSNDVDNDAYKVSLSEGQFGQVQIRYFGQDGLVCSDNFDNTDANVDLELD
nr:hypothetical protein BaRGS_012147 [Batillaria attramentaria]